MHFFPQSPILTRKVLWVCALIEYLYQHLYLLKITGILLLTIGLTVVEKTIFHRIYPKVKASPRIWDDALVYAIHFPLKLYIWLSALVFSIAVAEEALTHDYYVFSLIEYLHKIGGFALCIWTLTRFINEFENQFSLVRRGKHDPTTLRGITQVLKIIVFTIGGLGMLQLFGIPLEGVIAFGGAGGIAAGLAAKDLLANFFGGLMIFLDKPFKIGDWVRSPDQEIEGTVEYIGWRLTRIRTFDQRPLFVPNAVFSTISLENPSRMANRRIKASFGLRYEDYGKVEPLSLEIEKMLKSHPDIDSVNRTCFVKLVAFGPYYLELQIYSFTKTTDWLKFQSIQQQVFIKTLEIVESFGCKIAYPITSLHRHSSSPFLPSAMEVENPSAAKNSEH